MAEKDQTDRGQALALFEKSILKKEKWRQISSLMPDPRGKTCLDVGADNGVLSLLLRQRGGRWFSADLDETAVAAIRRLVGERVHQLDGGPTEFEPGTFDLVVIVDFLEHIPTDREFVGELKRILKPGGRLIINVPHLKPFSLLNRLRHLIGLTDELHGHLRPGYDLAGLGRLLRPGFSIETSRTYSKTFSEAIDTLLGGVYLFLQGRRAPGRSTRKGTIVTAAEIRRNQKEFALLKALYPFMWMISKLDWLLPFWSGYKLIVAARLNSDQPGGTE